MRRRSGRRTAPILLVRRVLCAAFTLTAVLMLVRPGGAVAASAGSDSADSASDRSAAPTPAARTVPATAVSVPIRLSDPAVVSLLRPGVHIDLYAGEPGLPLQQLGADLLVAMVPKATGDNVGPGNSGGALIVLAVTASQAAKIIAGSAATVVVATVGPVRTTPGDP